MKIKQLSLDNTEVLSSQIEISSIKTVMLELILNSIDAHSTQIKVHVISSSNISVQDNGDGIEPDDLRSLDRNCKLIINS